MNKTATSENISISQLESNIKIERLLSKETRQRLEVLQEQIKATPAQVSQAANITLRYENTYIITLKNGFGGKYLKSSEIRDLLNNIINSYNNYLHESFTFFSLPVVELSALDLNSLDYLDSLDTLDSYLDTLKQYCDDNAQRYPNYRGASNKLSFSDLSEAISVLRSIDINHLYSYILQSGVSKDREEILNRYNYNLRNASMTLQSVNSRIEDYKRIIDGYENDAISLFGGDGQEMQIAYVTSDYYNTLVMNQAALLDQKAELEQRIEKIKDILEVFEEGSSSADSQAVVDEYNRVYSDAEAIQAIVLEFAEEALNSDNIRNSFLTYTSAQTGSDSTLNRSTIKKSVICGVAGAVVACCIWFIVCFYEEMKKGDKKNEEA